jgi:hypothetical protein
MGATLDMEHIAKELGAERRGKVSARGGYFGALQLAAEVVARFRVPDGGGRPTDPSWSEQRLVRLSPHAGGSVIARTSCTNYCESRTNRPNQRLKRDRGRRLGFSNFRAQRVPYAKEMTR